MNTPSERLFIRSIVADAIASGCAVSVFSGDACAIRRSVDETAVMAAIMATGENALVLTSTETDKPVDYIYIIYGNEKLTCEFSEGF